jgi:arginine repressor
MPEPKRGGKLAAMKVLMINRPAATTDEIVAALKAAGYAEVSTSTVSTVRSDLMNTCRVLPEHFEGKVPVTSEDLARVKAKG